MKFKSILYSAAIIAACVACKKDEDESSPLPYLDGTLKIDGLDEFVSPGQKVTLRANGITSPEGKDVNYYWRVAPSMTKNDTTDIFEHTFSDTLRTYTIYCTASAEGYNSTSVMAYSTVVKAGKDGSIQGIDAFREAIPGTDYYQTAIGTQTWTQNNLGNTTGGSPYGGSALMADIFGKYYNYDDAVAACEALEGGNWKLPSKEDWEILEAYLKQQNSETYGKTPAAAIMADATFNSNKMWEYWPAVGTIKNGSGLSVIPTGYAIFGTNGSETDYSEGKYEEIYNYATFWTSTSTDDPGKAYYKYIYLNDPDFFTGVGNKLSFGASVRCIKK